MDPVEEVYRTDHTRLWRSLVGFCGDSDVAAEAEAEAYSQAIARGDELHNPRAWIWRAAFRIAAGLLADRGQQVPPPGETPQLDTPLVEFLSLLGDLGRAESACVPQDDGGPLLLGQLAEQGQELDQRGVELRGLAGRGDLLATVGQQPGG
ncbi:MAG: hypothetical protein AAGA93_23690, partial [Actinomycetota bacterium]